MREHKSSIFLVVQALAFTVVLVGCINLDDVAGLTKLADRAQQTLPTVVKDIPASCERQNSFIADIPSAEKPPQTELQDCKLYQDVADHITKDQAVLVTYFDSLGKLASNTPLSYDQNIDTNVATIGKLPNLSKQTIAASEAGQKIAKVLADLATKGYREHKLNSIVARTDEPIQQLTSALKTVILVDYRGILANESTIMDVYYKSPLEAATTERLTRIVVERQYEGDRAALNSRQEAAVAYGKVMDNLASMHHKLKVEAEKKANLRAIAAEIGPEIASLKDALTQLQTGVK